MTKMQVIYDGVIEGVVPAVMATVPVNSRPSAIKIEVPTKAVVLAKGNKALVVEYQWTVDDKLAAADLARIADWAEDENAGSFVSGSSPPEWVKIDPETKKIWSWTIDTEGKWVMTSNALPTEVAGASVTGATILRFISPTKALLIGDINDENIRNRVVVFPGQYNEYSYGSTGSGRYAATLTKADGVWQLTWHGRNDSRQWRSWYDSYNPEDDLLRGETLILGMNGADSVAGLDQWHPIIWTCQGGDTWVRFSPVRPAHGQDVAFSDHLATALTMTTTQYMDGVGGVTQTKFYSTLTGALLRDSAEANYSDGEIVARGLSIGCHMSREKLNQSVGFHKWHLETLDGTITGTIGETEDLDYVGFGGIESIAIGASGRSAVLPDFMTFTFYVLNYDGSESAIHKIITSAGVVMDLPPDGQGYFMKQDGAVVTIPEGYAGKGAPGRDVALGYRHAYFVAQEKEISFTANMDEMSFADNYAVVGVSMTDGARIIRVDDGVTLISVDGAGARAVVGRDGRYAMVVDGEGLARLFDLTKPSATRDETDADSEAVKARLEKERGWPRITARAKIAVSKLPAANADDPLTSLAVLTTRKGNGEPGTNLLLCDVDASGQFAPVRKESPTGNVVAYATKPVGAPNVLDKLYFSGKTLALLLAAPKETSP